MLLIVKIILQKLKSGIGIRMRKKGLLVRLNSQGTVQNCFFIRSLKKFLFCIDITTGIYCCHLLSDTGTVPPDQIEFISYLVFVMYMYRKTGLVTVAFFGCTGY